MAKPSDGLLAFWLVLDLFWSVGVIAGCAYLVFWKGQSGWWFVLAIFLVSSGSLFKALRKRFSVEEAED